MFIKQKRAASADVKIVNFFLEVNKDMKKYQILKNDGDE
jgi:hypothetical protein